jgi:hypothetical protein
MRTLGVPGLLLVLAVLGAGCDNEQPEQPGEHTAELTFIAAGAQVALYRVFEISEDSNSDGVPDGEPTLYCEAHVNQSGTQQFRVATSVPWSFSLRVRLLREGQTQPETLLVSDQPGDSIAAYDVSSEELFDQRDPITLSVAAGRCTLDHDQLCVPDVVPDTCATTGTEYCERVGVCDGDPSESCIINPADTSQCVLEGSGCDCVALGQGTCVDGHCFDPPDTVSPNRCEPSCAERGAGTTCLPTTVDRSISFASPGRLLTGANRELMASDTNVLAELDPFEFGTLCNPLTNPGCRNTVCPGFDLGEPGVLHGGQPLRIKFDEGDTLIVEGRILNQSVPPGIVFAPGGGAQNVQVNLFIDGRPATPEGSTVAAADQSTAIDFSFTAR